MTSKEALKNITDWIEYFTRLDYVEPIVRDEVQKNFYDAYHKTRPELELIKKDLKVLDILKENATLHVVNKDVKSIQITITTCDDRFKQIEEWLNEK